MRRLLAVTALGWFACGPQKEPTVAAPPAASSSSSAPAPSASSAEATYEKVVIDTYHGDQVKDPYRWLEDDKSPDVQAFTDRQNAATRKYLDAGDLRGKLRGRLDELLQIGFVNSPVLRKGDKKHPRRYFHSRREGKQDQPIVYVREGLEGKDRPLLDPSTFGEDKTTALDWWYVNDLGDKVAYGYSISGNEQSTLHVRDVATGKDLPDVITRTRASYVSWLPDGSGFYYVREPDPTTVPKGEEHYHRGIWFHALGKDPSVDARVFPPAGEERPMTDSPHAEVSPSGRWLLVRVAHGWAKASVYLLDRKAKEAKWVTLVAGVDALFDPTFHRIGKEDVVFLRSNEGAPGFQIVRVDPAHPAREKWKVVVPESPDPIRDFECVGDSLYVSYLHKASSRLERRDLADKLLEDIPLPVLGTATVPHGDSEGDEAMFEVQSYAYPPEIRRYDPKTKKQTVWAKTEAPGFDATSIVVEQIEAPSKDGTKITAFLVKKKSTPKDGTAPGVLYGYGGFNISQTPSFNRAVMAFLERGGVYVVANLRGGAEYGEAWHRAGMLDKKQNVFDDAIAVAETLGKEGFVGKQRLGALGGSNGGLLTGALLTQRPDLFRAVVSAVPLLDMLRYHHFLIAKLWIAEYGSSDDPKQYQWLKAYSPYHKVVDKTPYPAVLLMTAESDSRVDPMHARKMAARLQAATASAHPVLLRVETKAGHGAGKPRSKQLEELSDQWTFFFRELGVSF
ncbi:MAG: S9 family peptidase [Myxococcales bacterium]|nr:S9 family peptidase [Myxococcales bacterium]